MKACCLEMNRSCLYQCCELLPEDVPQAYNLHSNAKYSLHKNPKLILISLFFFYKTAVQGRNFNYIEKSAAFMILMSMNSF